MTRIRVQRNVRLRLKAADAAAAPRQNVRTPAVGAGSPYLVAGAIGGCSSSPDSSPSTASKSLASRKLRYTEAKRT